MDAQIIASLCPKAQIFVYFATFDQKGWVDLLNKVIQTAPVALSISWGATEDGPGVWSDAARTVISQQLSAAASRGITVCVASGDDGTSGTDSSGNLLTGKRTHVNFPGSSPFVLSVGGTMLTGTAASS